jgi:hypothetical protein
VHRVQHLAEASVGESLDRGADHFEVPGVVDARPSRKEDAVDGREDVLVTRPGNDSAHFGETLGSTLKRRIVAPQKQKMLQRNNASD